jgi:O-methyltransferase involved in polyketide biosynthesis
MATVLRHKEQFLFMAEGVFMYLDGMDVRLLVLEIRQRFRDLGLDAMFRSGIRDNREMEQWHIGIQFLDEGSYFDSEEKKLGWLKILKYIELIRKTQWTVHYLLD